MNDGILFYWFMWMGWVMAAFLMMKGKSRNRLIFILLAGIILSGYSISYSLGTVNAAFIYFFSIGFAHIVRNSDGLLYYLIGSFILATTYISVQLFSLYDPVKLVFEKKIILVIVLVLVLVLISKRQIDLFYLPLTGLFIGDSLYQILIYRLTGKVEIGSLYVLDLLASASMILLFMVILVDMFKKMRRVTFKKVNSAKQI